MAALLEAVGSAVPRASVAAARSKKAEPAIKPPPRIVEATASNLEHALGFHLFNGFQKVQEAFMAMDKAGTGLITHADFCNVLAMVDMNVPPRELKLLLRHYDPHNTGKLPYADFNQHLLQLVQQRDGRTQFVPPPMAPVPLTDTGLKRPVALHSEWERRFLQATCQRVTDIEALFREFDVDGSGGITKDEFFAGLQAYGIKLPREQADRLADLYDTNGDGIISLQEFSSRMMRMLQQSAILGKPQLREPARIPTPILARPTCPLLSADKVMDLLAQKMFSRFKNVKQAFWLFDKDKSGAVSREEFRESLAGLGFFLSDSEYEKVANHFDPTRSGKITYAQFNNLVGSIIHPGERGTLLVGRDASPQLKLWVEAKFAKDIMRGCADPDEAFALLDRDGSGALSSAEFILAVKQRGIFLGDEEGASLVARYDPEGTGVVTKSEFRKRIMYMLTQSATPRPEKQVPVLGTLMERKDVETRLVDSLFSKYKRVQRAFRDFDHDHSGHITYEEFRQAIRDIGMELSDEDFAEFIKTYDLNGDGLISYEEFNYQVGKLIHPSENGQIVVRPMFNHDPVGRKKKIEREIATNVESRFAQAALGGLQHAQDMFARFDVDKSGTISHSEFIAALEAFGIDLTFNESKVLLDSFDTNKDGVVSLEEFTQNFTRYLGELGLVNKARRASAAAARRKGSSASQIKPAEVMRPGNRIDLAVAFTDPPPVVKIPSPIRKPGRTEVTATKPLVQSPIRGPLRSQGSRRSHGNSSPIVVAGNAGPDSFEAGPPVVPKLASLTTDGRQESPPSGPADQPVAQSSVLPSAHSMQTLSLSTETRLSNQVIHGWQLITQRLRLADPDKTGAMPSLRFRAVMEQCGVHLADSEWRELYQRYVRDGDFRYVRLLKKIYAEKYGRQLSSRLGSSGSLPML